MMTKTFEDWRDLITENLITDDDINQIINNQKTLDELRILVTEKQYLNTTELLIKLKRLLSNNILVENKRDAKQI